jgi:hypothetical protein
MEEQAIGDEVLDTAHIPDAIPQWMSSRSAEAVEIRDQLEAIVRFFDDLDAAIDALGPQVDIRAYELSQDTREQMLKGLLLDLAEQSRKDSMAPEGPVLAGWEHPVDPLQLEHDVPGPCGPL